jgi:hypothetical protein
VPFYLLPRLKLSCLRLLRSPLSSLYNPIRQRAFLPFLSLSLLVQMKRQPIPSTKGRKNTALIIGGMVTMMMNIVSCRTKTPRLSLLNSNRELKNLTLRNNIKILISTILAPPTLFWSRWTKFVLTTRRTVTHNFQIE